MEVLKPEINCFKESPGGNGSLRWTTFTDATRWNYSTLQLFIHFRLFIYFLLNPAGNGSSRI
jgi:hypothetical protein